MKYIIAMVFLLILATAFFIIRPDPEIIPERSVTTPRTVTAPEPGAMKTDEPEDADTAASIRREQMAAEFEKLQRARRHLESRLNRLRAIFWGMELPREERDEITATMRNGYALLKNKKLMGAYSSVEEISNELSKVEFVHGQLEKLEVTHRSRE